MIDLDKEHGVNPSLEVCYLCGEAKGVVLFGKLKNRTRQMFAEQGIPTDGGKAPYKVTTDTEPCNQCKEHMKIGIILISVDEKLTTDKTNPYKTGGYVVVRDEFIKDLPITPTELKDGILKARVAFLPDEVWNMMGLPGLKTRLEKVG